MSNPFAALGIDPAAIVAQTIGTMASVPATLTKVTPGTYDVNNPTSGIQSTSAPYACKAVMTEFVQTVLADSIVRKTKGKIVVLLGTVQGGAVPGNADSITLVPPTGASRTFTITGKVGIDAAGATAECEVED